MKLHDEKSALKKIAAQISEWTGINDPEERFYPKIGDSEIDLTITAGNYMFLIEFKRSGAASPVNTAIWNLMESIDHAGENAIPVVAVPFMGDVGRELCAKNGISWLDLSGNAHIEAQGLRIHIEGKPNQYKSTGRPKNVFAPKSSRIARHLLIEPNRFITQRDLTHETNLDEGLVSRVVRELEKLDLLNRNDLGAIKPKEPSILLKAWRERYSFTRHQIIKGFVAERNSVDLLSGLVQIFDQQKIDYAVTGLSAAWLLTHFASYRTSTIFLTEEPPAEIQAKLNFVKEDRGSNVWLVIPNDEDVFFRSSTVEGIRCVHPIQIYLDLKDHPERSNEAAENIQEQFLRWENLND